MAIASRVGVSLLLANLALAAQYFSVPFSTKYYGPDGPWQAITATVGGNDSTRPLAEELDRAEVDLLPGGVFASNILSTNGCRSWGQQCSGSGTWNPASFYPRPDISFGPDWTNDAAGISGLANQQWIKGMTVNGQTSWETSLMSVTNVTVSGRNGGEYGPSLGTFSLGSEDGPRQCWGPTTCAFIFPGWLYNQSITPSYSYGLHIGSAAFDYQGSLTFGGYDKGRVLRPSHTFNDQWTDLIDIGMGVESGGSPFNFTTQTGFLLDDEDRNVPQQVIPDPLSPYLSLPGKTCESIAAQLPVRYDSSLEYYIWNTEDPRYRNVVSSPSYLSFMFAGAGTGNVTIKVPFALLNLTLERPIINEPTPYFPCVPFEPVNNSGRRDRYRLGRAFLQAAFIGRNWNTGTAWLAQAPGPGAARTGLGEQMADIADDDEELKDLNSDPAAFATSWEPWLTPLEAQAAPNPTNPENPSDTSNPDQPVTSSNIPVSSEPNSGPGLSTGAQAGIGVGAGVFALGAISLIAFLLIRRRKQKAEDELVEITAEPKTPRHTMMPPQYGQAYAYYNAERPIGPVQVHEAPAGMKNDIYHEYRPPQVEMSAAPQSPSSNRI